MSKDHKNLVKISDHPTLVVAIGLGAHDAHLVNTANQLASKMSARVHLVHCVEPSPAAAWIETYYAPEAKLDTMRVEDAQAALMEIAKQIKTPEPSTQRVRVGDPGFGVAIEAEAIGAAMILCGAKNVSHKHLLPALSPAMAIMAAAKLPVMVVREDIAPESLGNDWALIVADDLQPHSQKALSFAAAMARKTGAKKIQHVTVDPPAPFEKAQESLHQFFGTHWPDEAVSVAFDEKFEQRRPHLQSALKERSQPFQQRLQAFGCELACTVEHGDVAEQLASLIGREKPTALIVGHHAQLHSRPFKLGKLPLAALLSFPLAVIIVP